VSERGNVPLLALPVPSVVTAASRIAIGSGLVRIGATNPSSGASPFTSGDMLAYPFVLTAMTTIYKGFWVNGTSAGNNAVVAIYDADYNLLVQSAPTGLSGTSAPQAVTMVAKLPAGQYYCVLAHDSGTTNRFFRYSINTIGASMWRSFGCWKQASTTLASLPNPATPAACTNIAFPMFGFITRSNFDV
jgi:hypothetical protein